MPSQQNNSNKAYVYIGLLSSVIIGFLVWLIYFKTPAKPTGDWVGDLPLVNAVLNSICFMFLVAGFSFIKFGKKTAHILCMLSATLSSALFVVSYIIYHHFQGDTKFLAQGPIRTVYFFILITHIVLSIPLVPMVLTTLWHAFKKNNEKHRKIARLTFPVWTYVSITGVLIYVLLNNFNL